MTYDPRPLDTTVVMLPPDLQDLVERLAENAHDVWARQRLTDGWTFGPRRNDQLKHHPDLVPYGELPDQEKQYDRNAVEGTLRAILSLGYQITPPVDDRT